MVNAGTLTDAVTAAERYASVGQASARSGGHGGQARIAGVETSAVVESKEVDPDEGKVLKLLESLHGLVKEQGSRIASLEQSGQNSSGRERPSSQGPPRGKGCWQCGDLSHFRRDCPKNRKGAGAKADSTQRAGNC